MELATLMFRYDNGMMDGNGTGWFWGALMMLIVLLTVVAIVWLIVRPTHPAAAPSPPSADVNFRAREALGMRLANGEITPEEYQDRIAHLR